MTRGINSQPHVSPFGAVLNEQLRRRGFTQSDLARATGVSPSYISHMMTRGKVSPKWADLVADYLKLVEKERARLHAAAAGTWGYKLDLTKP